MLEIITLELTSFQQNTRIICCPAAQEAIVLDPGGEALRIVEVLRDKQLECRQIWLTHSHLDHCGGVSDLKAECGAELYAHPDEAFFRSAVTELCEFYGIVDDSMKNCSEPEHFLSGGEKLQLGDREFEVLFTPGHSPGHLCYYCKDEGLLFTGDVLFAGSIGRSDLPGGDHKVLMKSIKEVLLPLPPETRVFAGHGPETTLGAEAQSNPFLTGV